MGGSYHERRPGRQSSSLAAVAAEIDDAWVLDVEDGGDPSLKAEAWLVEQAGVCVNSQPV